MNIDLMKNEKSEPIGFIGIIKEISKRTSTEVGLKITQDFLKIESQDIELDEILKQFIRKQLATS